jgi:hypothetical protein
MMSLECRQWGQAKLGRRRRRHVSIFEALEVSGHIVES